MISATPTFNRTNKLDKNGKGLVHIRVIANRKSTFISTNVKVYPAHWDISRKRVKNTNPNWQDLNHAIDTILLRVDQIDSEAIKNGHCPSLKTIVRKIKDLHSGAALIDFLDKELENRRSKISAGTFRKDRTKIKIMKLFFDSSVRLIDIDYDLIFELDQFLTKRNISKNTIAGYHKCLRLYLNIGKNKNLIQSDPYLNFKVETEDREMSFLDQDQVDAIKAVVFPDGLKSVHELVRDMFVFSCYTGLRISDVTTVKNDNFRETSQGEIYLTFIMVKTVKKIRDFPLHSVLNGQAMDIYFKYKGEKDQPLFPSISHKHINELLKDIANLADIDINLTFHVSRHTFGTSLAAEYNDPFIIKELMGHSKIETSLGYIHLRPGAIEKKIKSMEKYKKTHQITTRPLTSVMDVKTGKLELEELTDDFKYIIPKTSHHYFKTNFGADWKKTFLPRLKKAMEENGFETYVTGNLMLDNMVELRFIKRSN